MCSGEAHGDAVTAEAGEHHKFPEKDPSLGWHGLCLGVNSDPWGHRLWTVPADCLLCMLGFIFIVVV